MKFLSNLLLLPLMLASGCTVADDPFLTASTGKPKYGQASAHEIPQAMALASIPALAAKVASTRETEKDDALVQRVLYRNGSDIAGENALTLETGKPGNIRFRHGPTVAQLARELRAAFPDVVMQPLPANRANAYGPYGLAMGRSSGGSRCVFAWQLIPANAQDPKPHILRLRYCDPQMNETVLSSLMDGLILRQSAAAVSYSYAPPVNGYASAQSSPMIQAPMNQAAINQAQVAAQDADAAPEQLKPKLAIKHRVIAAAKPATPPAKQVATGPIIPLPD
ncbi:cellulose biosynthesis protein BcsN [Allorhizobium taibaishanense]|uniref:Cellulose biosynthesis protein BcsN n=1 Tax=Allorhizobium taibaishanense TaxID=887144 RepID=A0A1Q9A9J6_9HYPH|nr:cellulose biosynthesis protein BcsN [Allorhizobium taibaishanense]MBB4009885.1 hypothetical protein [Allorhizobium taibaishanense]OLP51515.1 hypothetical protein BJF91_15840 [Allorhizobium taibaishanense]